MGEIDADTVESLSDQANSGARLHVSELSQVGAQISDPNRDILNTYIHDTELFSIQKMPSCSD